MYELTLTIYLDLNSDKEHLISITYTGTDLFEMKSVIDEKILDAMNEFNANSGEVFVEMDIEHNGEYYDHDEQTIFVDLQNNRIQYGI